MRERVYNFNPGPSALPDAVLRKAREEWMDYEGTGLSVMELSHRGETFEAILNRTVSLFKQLLNIPDNYEILFIQGGASMQFSMAPMNLLRPNKQASYVLTGLWAERAFQEARLFGKVRKAFCGQSENYARVPEPDELSYEPTDEYVHITTNNTIYGTQWKTFPQTGDVPLVADMSSDILSRPIDVKQFGLIYAGAQKNLGPAGVAVVIIRQDLIEKAQTNLPTMLQYRTYSRHRSLYNTPPTFAIYMIGEVLQWVKDQGGTSALARRNESKAALIYEAIDESDGFYIGRAEPKSRSLMNITFRLKNETLERQFIEEAKREGFIGIAGHRSTGGCRVSVYNAVSLEACEAFRQFMIDFQNRRG